MRKVTNRLGAVALLGLTAHAAYADVTVTYTGNNSGQVNISGATLFRPFFEVPASTNDFIDVDGNGVFGFDPNRNPIVQQLATPVGGGNDSITTVWAVQYRGVGSVNGLGEFISYQLCGTLNPSIPAELGLLNRFKWAEGGQKTGGPGSDCDENGSTDNDSGSPLCPESVDLAIVDVPTFWATIGGPGEAKWDRNPREEGYGQNPIFSNTGWNSMLQSLTRDCGSGEVSLNTNTSSPDGNTVYDNRVAWAVITYCGNRGLGKANYSINDIKHSFVTGRTRSGENLAVITRSAGSGTRNGIMNTTGIDASWGRGDNLENEWNVTDNANLGPNRRLTNAEGSSGVERAMQVSRLGLGYTGLFGNERSAFDANAGRYEVLNIKFDDRGGNAFVRPSLTSSLDNADPSSGYQLGGEVTFVSRGAVGQDDENAPNYMANRAASYYMRNILGSIAAFVSSPGLDNNFNMPGEYLANVFVLSAGVDALPADDDASNFIENPNFNQNLQDFIRSNNTLNVPDYGTKNPAGLVPRRVVGNWSDGTTNDSTYNYKDTVGDTKKIARDAKLAERNRVAFDFNNDLKRNVNDIAGSVAALAAPLNYEAGKVWAGDKGDQTENVVIVHILGDTNGSGEFDLKDIRYAADGLALNPSADNGDDFGPLLDRKAGFTAADTAFGGNLFGTTLATPKAYAAGDSRGDIAGATPVPGADPRGYDGVINAKDIDYIYANFGDWQNLDEAVYIDLSADQTGPEQVEGKWVLLIDQKDVDELVRGILGTDYGDVDLDGDVDDADKAIVEANQGQEDLGWAGGDLNGDGVVDGLDLDFFEEENPCDGSVRGDSNGDGGVDFDDIDCFVAGLIDQGNWEGCGTGAPAECFVAVNDINQDNSVDFNDIDGFVECLINGCP